MEPSDRSSGCWGHALPLPLSPMMSWCAKWVQPLALPTCEPRGTYFFAGWYVRCVLLKQKPSPMLTVILISNKFLDCLGKIKKKLYSIQRPFLIFATVFNPLWLAGSTDTGGQLDLTGPFSSFLNDSIELRVHSYWLFTGVLQTSWNTYLRQSLLSSRGEQTRNKCRNMGTKVEKVRVRGQHLTVRDMQRGSWAHV